MWQHAIVNKPILDSQNLFLENQKKNVDDLQTLKKVIQLIIMAMVLLDTGFVLTEIVYFNKIDDFRKCCESDGSDGHGRGKHSKIQ